METAERRAGSSYGVINGFGVFLTLGNRGNDHKNLVFCGGLGQQLLSLDEGQHGEEVLAKEGGGVSDGAEKALNGR